MNWKKKQLVGGVIFLCLLLGLSGSVLAAAKMLEAAQWYKQDDLDCHVYAHTLNYNNLTWNAIKPGAWTT